MINHSPVQRQLLVVGIKAGEVCSRPASLVDIYPTFLDYSGLSANPNKELGGPKLDGYSLRPLLENPQSVWDGPERLS